MSKLLLTKDGLKTLKEVKAKILATPEAFDMDTLCDPSKWHTERNPECGTVACIAGWAVILHDKKKLVRGWGQDWAHRAKEILFGAEKAPHVSSDGLFYEGQPSWKASESMEYNELTDNNEFKEAAKIAAAVIDRFIKRHTINGRPAKEVKA